MTGKRYEGFCPELAELVAASDPADPDPDVLNRIEAHIATCSVCDSAETALNTAVGVFRDARLAGVSPEFERELVNRLCKPDAEGESQP